MGVYVKFPDGSMHWDESKADPNVNGGGSVINSTTGQSIPGANRQSGSSGPGGNGVRGTQANPNGSYQAGPGAVGSQFGSGGFTSGQQGIAPTGNTTPFGNYVAQNMMPAPPPLATAAGPQLFPDDPTGELAYRKRQADDQAQQAAAHQMLPYGSTGYQGAPQTTDPYNPAWGGR